MDSFEINKIIAAVVVIFVVIFGITKISDIIYYVEKPSQSAYKVEFAETDSTKASAAVEAVQWSLPCASAFPRAIACTCPYCVQMASILRSFFTI